MPPPGILPDPGMGPGSPALQVGSSQPEPQGGGGHGAREELHGEHRGYRPWAPTAAVAESLRPGCRAHWASLVGQTVKNPPAMRETWVQPLGWDSLGEGMTTRSNILAWRIPLTEEPGGLHSPWGHTESEMTEAT